MILFAELTAISQAVKPQISTIDSSRTPPGCAYTLDDWKGSILAWTPYQALSNSESFLMQIDGQSLEIPINQFRDDNHISAFNGKYYIEVHTPVWKQIGSELRTAKAILRVINTQANTETQLIVRASEGC